MAYFSAGIGCALVFPGKNSFVYPRWIEADSQDNPYLRIAIIYCMSLGVGCILTAILIKRMDRSQSIVISTICAIIIWIGKLSGESMLLQYIITVILGLGIGMLETTAPLYISENSSPNFRAIFSSLCILPFNAGERLQLQIADLSYSALVTAALIFLVFGSTLTLPQPAQHLLAQGHELAEQRFFELRGVDDASKREFEEMRQHLAEAKPRLSFGLLANKGVRAVCLVNWLVHLTGYPQINDVSLRSFSESSWAWITSNPINTVLYFIQLLGPCLSPAIVERFGRQPLIMASALLSFFCHVTIAMLIGIPIPGITSSNVIRFTRIIYWILTTAIFLPISMTIRGELLSPQLKPIVGCLVVIINSVLSVTINVIFRSIYSVYNANYLVNMQALFAFYAAMSITLTLYVFDLPETKGLTLTEIQKPLQNRNENNPGPASPQTM